MPEIHQGWVTCCNLLQLSATFCVFEGSCFLWLVRTTPICNQRGEIVAAMEISLNITERKLLESELEKSEHKYRAFFNNIPNPVFVLDQKTLKILECNDSVRAVYGYRLQLVGASCRYHNRTGDRTWR